jgi:hypothetical protein
MSSEWLKAKPNQQDNASIFCIISQILSKALIFAGGGPSEFANSTFAASNEARPPDLSSFVGEGQPPT